jgi:Raf kinase inhibitor-like YbhB/YbcL family protein
MRLALIGLISLAAAFAADRPAERTAPPGEPAMKISSPAFAMNQPIPPKYTCDGDDVNPPLAIQGVPAEAKSLALIVDDPDAPGRTWVHWAVWNIPPTTTAIPENSVPNRAMQGTNDFGKTRWGGPCPPGGMHHYRFRAFALKAAPNIPAGSKVAELAKAMQGSILAEAEWIGTYSRAR